MFEDGGGNVAQRRIGFGGCRSDASRRRQGFLFPLFVVHGAAGGEGKGDSRFGAVVIAVSLLLAKGEGGVKGGEGLLRCFVGKMVRPIFDWRQGSRLFFWWDKRKGRRPEKRNTLRVWRVPCAGNSRPAQGVRYLRILQGTCIVELMTKEHSCPSRISRTCARGPGS